MRGPEIWRGGVEWEMEILWGRREVVWEDAEGRVAGDTVCGDGAKGSEEGEVRFGKGEFCE
jgi:hypothetical protein